MSVYVCLCICVCVRVSVYVNAYLLPVEVGVSGIGVKRTNEQCSKTEKRTNELSYSCLNCKVYVIHVHDSVVPSPYILHCRRCAVQQHARMLNLRLRPPCMFWDGVHDCAVY